ncbi:MAG: ATP-binding protein [Syntrophales bacterium]
MKKGKSYRSLYLPAWSIVAAVVTLLAIIAVSTYRNMSRETGRMEESLVREGLVIIRAIEAGVRADFSAAPPQEQRLQKLVAEVAREPEIAAILIFDGEGRIVADSRIPQATPDRVSGAASFRVLLQEKGVITRYRELPEGPQVFEVVQPFRPFTYYASPSQLGAVEERVVQAELPLRRWAADKMIVLSLRLETFAAARREDRHHTFLMAAILIALGTGALYFIFVVQNYSLVDRTLARMKSYTENVVESMADGLIAIDRQGRVVTLNRQAAEIFGRKHPEGRSITDLLGDGVEAILGPPEARALVRDHEIEIRRGADARIPLSLSAAPLRDDAGQELGSVILIRDMRQIRELQEKVRRSERLVSLGRLAAGVAHEIRNPLSSIRGFAQYFQKRFKGQTEEEGYAAVMVNEVDRLNRVITELLEFAAAKEPRRESHSVAEIAEHALKLLAPDIASRRVSVEREYEPDLPLIAADRDQITQVFINILLNALQSMEEGGTVRIAVRRSAAPAGVEIGIADTGAGIPAEDLQKVFEPFFSRKRKGTGLGLAIVHQIVAGHRGEIGVESVAGKGTTFRIILPGNGAVVSPRTV